MVSLPKIDQKNSKEILKIEFNEEPEQESPKILLKPEIQVELQQQHGKQSQILSDGGKLDNRSREQRDDKLMKSTKSLKGDLNIPSERKQSLKENNSDCKRGKDEESQSRIMSSRENF